VSAAAAFVGACAAASDGALARNPDAGMPTDTTHHHAVDIGLQILARPHQDPRSSPKLLRHAADSRSQADRRRNAMPDCIPSCWAAGSAVLQLHRARPTPKLFVEGRE
jgi:hypothetical protein